MDLIVLRSIPRRKSESESPDANREEQNSANGRLISMDEIRRRWAKKQEVRRALLSYMPQPA
jgi:hypothetical protein